jgi:hypothetical protein
MWNFSGPDESRGRGDKWAFGFAVTQEGAMTKAFSPSNLTMSAEKRLGEQVLDAVSLPGQLLKGTDNDEHEILTRMSTAFEAAVNRGAVDLGGVVDQSWKSVKRTSLYDIKTQEDLEERTRDMTADIAEQLESVVANLSSVLGAAGFDGDMAAKMANSSLYLRVSRESATAYHQLHVFLLTTAQLNKGGWELAKRQLKHHADNLAHIRRSKGRRLSAVMGLYAYLRDGQEKGWQSFGIQKIAIDRLAELVTTVSDSGSTVGTSACNWCNSTIHKGNKSQCPFGHQKRQQAIRSAKAVLAALGTPPTDATDTSPSDSG